MTSRSDDQKLLAQSIDKLLMYCAGDPKNVCSVQMLHSLLSQIGLHYTHWTLPMGTFSILGGEYRRSLKMPVEPDVIPNWIVGMAQKQLPPSDATRIELILIAEQL